MAGRRSIWQSVAAVSLSGEKRYVHALYLAARDPRPLSAMLPQHFYSDLDRGPSSWRALDKTLHLLLTFP